MSSVASRGTFFRSSMRWNNKSCESAVIVPAKGPQLISPWRNPGHSKTIGVKSPGFSIKIMSNNKMVDHVGSFRNHYGLLHFKKLPNVWKKPLQEQPSTDRTVEPLKQTTSHDMLSDKQVQNEDLNGVLYTNQLGFRNITASS